MPVLEQHPNSADLEAFVLGTLDDASLASVEPHVAECPTCQEHAAAVSGDTFVELLRRVHTQVGPRFGALAEVARLQTPAPDPARTEEVVLAPATPAESDAIEALASVPEGLARHERYRVVRLLGEGGMGSVYEAEHRVMQRPVALKVINRAYTTRPAAVERFRREVRAAARLSHPNIVTTYDAEDAGDTLFLAMEYVEGTSLGRLVKERGPLPVAEACKYIRQAALGLQHAHERGMVHRDVKPDNLILVASPVASLSGVVKVLDFGLAVLTAERGSELTDTNVVMGTPDFMAPEQAEDSRAADIRADVYSLGCTLYFLLTGSVPYPAPTPMLKLLAHREQPVPSIHGARPEVPAELAAVLSRMLAKKPEDRYQTPREVAAALEAFTRPRPADTSDTVALRRPGESSRRPRRRLPLVALAALLLLSAAVVVYRIQTDKGELVITTESDDVHVVIKQGGKVVDIIDTKTNKQITLALRSGDYELALKDGPQGLRLSPVKVTVKRGETVLATIERVTKPVAEKVGEVRRFEGHDGLGGPAFSPDGRYALWNDGKVVYLWDVATWREIHRTVIDTLGAGFVAFHPDGKRAVSCGSDKTIREWNLKTGEELRRFDGNITQVHDVAISADSCLMVSSTDLHPGILLWDYATGKEVRPCIGEYPAARRVAISPDGRRVLSGHADGMRLWDVKTGKVVHRFDGYKEPVSCAAFSPDGSRALSGSWDKSVRVWDIATGRELRRFLGHSDRVECVAFSHDSKRILSGGWDRSLRLWDAETGAELARFSNHTGVITGVAFSPDDRYALSAGTDKTVRLWRLPEPPPPEKVGEVRQFNGHTKRVSAVAFFKDGRRFASCGFDGTIRIWEVATGEELARLVGHNHSDIDCLAVSPDQCLLLSGGFDNTLRLWDIKTGKQLHSFAHSNRVCSVAISPDSRWALSGSHDHTVRLFDLKDRKEVHRFDAHTWCVGQVAISSDGRRAASASWDRTVRIYDLEKREEVACLRGHTDAVSAVGFSPDGSLVLTGGRPKNVRLWDVKTGKELRRFEGHTDLVYSVAFSPDGRRALSAGEDSTVRLWDVNTAKELHCFARQRGIVRCVAFSPDGRSALSCGEDNAIRLWRLPEPPAKKNP